MVRKERWVRANGCIYRDDEKFDLEKLKDFFAEKYFKTVSCLGGEVAGDFQNTRCYNLKIIIFQLLSMI